MRDYLNEALATIPGIADLDRTIDRLAERVRTFNKVPADLILTGRRALVAEIQAIAASDDEWPEDIARRSYDILKIVEMQQAEKTLTESALTIATSNRDEAIRNGSAKAVGYLVAPLRDLLEDAREALVELKGARTAQDVLDAGGSTVDAWNRLGDYGNTYAAIRETQRQLCVNALGGERGTKPSVELGDLAFLGHQRVHLEEVLERGGEVRNYNDFNPGWLKSVRTEGEVHKAFQRADNRQHLVELLDSAADIWMPTLRQATEAWVEQRRAIAQSEAAYSDKHGVGNYPANRPDERALRVHQSAGLMRQPLKNS